MKEQIINWVMTAIASVGGIGGCIAIVCTIIKTFGGNGLKNKLASLRVDTDKSIQLGMDNIASKVNTDITVDISRQLDNAIRKELTEQKEINCTLLEEINGLKTAMSLNLMVMSDMRTNSAEQRTSLLAMADSLAEVKAVEREEKTVAHVTVKEPIAENTVKEDIIKVVV